MLERQEALQKIKCFILDMDGTFYLGSRLLPGALDFMRYLAVSGRDHLFLTNNSSRHAVHYARKLTAMGWPAKARDILTSGEATARYIQKRRAGARIFLLGTPDLAREFRRHGFTLTADRPDYVVLGFDTTLTYHKLVTACSLIRAGVPFIATHPDLNCPTETGPIPDCGAMTALITAATGVKPLVIGKPNRAIIEAVFSKKDFPPQVMALVGDRLYTDIATGQNAGITSVLVLSGETQPADLAQARFKPDYVFADLGALAAALVAADKGEPCG
jgi:HAD superfamily hydrolase (TIGR01457 family)